MSFRSRRFFQVGEESAVRCCPREGRQPMKPKQLKRRQFIQYAGYGLGAAWLGSNFLMRDALANAPWLSKPLPRKFAANETVTLGNTGIKTSRLAMGTGTV